jgi:hypothetical protein
MLKWLASLLQSPSTTDTEPAAEVASAPDAAATLEGLFVEALREEGFMCREAADGIVMDNGLVFTLEYLESQPIGENALRTVSKVCCKHPVYFPEGLYEFQHASGGTEVEALLKGFRSWAQTDLATLVDSICDEGASSLVMEIPQDPDLQRKVFMGPYVHHVTVVPAAEECGDQRHEFCPCCLFTNSIEAFREHLADQAFFGIRLYACRDDDGMLAADCRVNGEDFPAGAELLKKYAATWPPRGLEFRKQYVVIRNAGKPAH